MTLEIFKKLTDFETLLYTAQERNYVMFGSIETKKKLSALYTIIYEKKSNMMSGCGRCALKEMKEIANDYFNFKKQLQEEEKIQEETENNPKRGRKKTKE